MLKLRYVQISEISSMQPPFHQFLPTARKSIKQNHGAAILVEGTSHQQGLVDLIVTCFNYLTL